jgi:acetyl-CoA carboxylase biotin carboxyl carrier protein
LKKKQGSKKVVGKTAEKKSPKGASTAAGPMSVDLLQQLVDLMAANDLNTVEVRDGEKRIVLKRGAVMMAAPAMSATAPVYAPAAQNASSAPAKAAVDADAGLVPIKSPMVGTFYAAGSPDAKPLASVGMRVEDETDVCIIEAMKVFNNIKAEARGTISKVLVTNGQTVEFGQPLFLVKPD